MKKSSILNILLALALVLLCAKSAFSSDSGNRNGKTSPDSVVINNIMTRTSIRAYQNKEVEKTKIETLLRAGMAAPTAVNKQPWHFVVVTDKNVLSAISEATPNASMAAKAPLAIVVCGDMNKALEGGGRDFWVQDASAATENILLAAHALGLGAVWTGTYPNQERCAKIAKLLHLPQNLVPLNTIVIGYPAENPTPKDKWNPQNVSYNYFGNAAGTPESVLNAEEKDEFHTFNVETDFHENPFQIGTGKGLILCAGDKSKSNAMTIGWIGLGTLWGHNDAITVYVAQKRYTHDFMEHAMYFTIMSFDKGHENVLDYMGNHSGRDGDKAKALGLHTLYTQHGTPYYAEANMVIECEMMYAAPFDKNGFREIPRKLYSNFPAGIHSVYIGRVVQAMKK